MTIKTKTALPIILLFIAQSSFAQNAEKADNTLELWIGILEIPFLFFCLFGGMQVVSAFSKGIFSSGMKMLFRGLLLLAMGHLITQAHRVFDLNLMTTVGQIAITVAISLGWFLCGLGMYRLFKDSRGVD